MLDSRRLLDTFLGLARIDGVSGHEGEVARNIRTRLQRLGIESAMDSAGDSSGGNSGNLLARLPGTTCSPAVLLCAHMDTILSTQELKVVREGDTFASDGTSILGADDRAGIAVILEILQALQENGVDHGPIEVLFTVSEEAGMQGVKSVDLDRLEAGMGFVFDSSAPCGSFVVEAPAAIAFRIVVKGKPAHAAVSPEKGIHAIQIASRAIAGLPLGRQGQLGMLNIGTIRGGRAMNVIPDEVEIVGETRNVHPEDLQRQVLLVQEAFERAAAEAGGGAEITWNQKYGGYNLGPDEPVVLAALRGIAAAGSEPRRIRYPGGSDANVLNERGIPTVNLGLGYMNVHSLQECMPISSLVQAAKIGLGILQELLPNQHQVAP